MTDSTEPVGVVVPAKKEIAMSVQQALCKHGRQFCSECRQWKVTHPCGKVEFFNSKPLWATFDPMLQVEKITERLNE